MKKRILALMLAVTAVFNVCPIYAEDSVAETVEENISETENAISSVTEENTVSGLVKLTCDSTDGSSIVIGNGEKIYVYANLDNSIDHIGIFRWQLRTPSGNWATVRDYVLPYAVVSEALVAGTLDENGNVYMSDEKYLDAFLNVWNFDRDHFINHEVGESRQLLLRDGTPVAASMGNPWKGIYHTGRALAECLRRLDKIC